MAAAKKVAKRKSKGKSVVTMSHIHRFCAAAIADGVRFLLWPLWPRALPWLCLTARARAQTVRLDDACAPIAQTVCNDLCSILVSAAMPHLQARDSDPAKPRKLGAEDLLAAVVSPQNIVARARHAQAPGGTPCARELTPPVGGAARRAGGRLPGRLGLWPRRRTAQRLRRQQRLRSAPATGIGGRRGGGGGGGGGRGDRSGGGG